jgi:hypothetical protein
MTPSSFLDIIDKAITAAQSYQPITDAEMARLRELSAGCGSLFRRDEERVAAGHSPHESLWAVTKRRERG